MDQITGLFENFDWDALLDTVMNWLTDLIVQIDFSTVLDALAGFVAGLL